MDAEREVTSSLGGPVDWNETLREGWVCGVVVDFNDVDLGFASRRLHSEGEDLCIGRCTVKSEGTEGSSMTLEGLADVPRLGEELHVSTNATSGVRCDTNQAGPALVIVGNVVDDLIVLHSGLDAIRYKWAPAYLELFLAIKDLARRNSVLRVQYIPVIYSLCADERKGSLADPPPELNVLLMAVGLQAFLGLKVE